MEDTAHVRAIRQGMIKYLLRYMQDMELMKNIVKQNEAAFEHKEEIIEQFDTVKKDFQSVLDYNFYEIEVKAVKDKELE